MTRNSHPLLLCLAVVLVFLAVRLAVWPHVVSSASAEGTTFAASAAELDAQVAAAQARVARTSDSWMELERAANAHLARGRACDRWNDFAAADSLMARAFETAPQGAGPFLGRARLNFTMHRFDRVEADLTRAESQLLLSPRVRAEIDAVRADVLLEQGSTPAAMAAYRRAAHTEPSFDNLARLAGGLVKTGELPAADKTYQDAARALPRSATRERAWVSLQRGLIALEATNLKRALQHFRDAETWYPGWWLAQEHIAEALALQGHDERALAIYQDVLARTQDPEFMDAIARIYRKRGDEAIAQQWIARAKQGHAARLARFPEAAAGHAEQHVRDFGPISEHRLK